MSGSTRNRRVSLLLAVVMCASMMAGCERIAGWQGAPTAPAKKAQQASTEPSRTYSTGKLTIDATNTGLNADASWAIKPVQGLPKIADMIEVDAYDFTADGVTQVDGVLKLTMPYDRASLAGKAAPGNVCAAYYNEEARGWEPVPFDIHEGDGTVTIYTDHLSVYGCFVVTNEYSREAYAAYSLPRLALTGAGDTRHIEVLREAAANMGQPGQQASDLGWAVLETSVALGESGLEVGSEIAGSAYLTSEFARLSKVAGALGIAVSSAQCISNLCQGKILEGYESLFEAMLGAGIYAMGATVSSIPMLFVLAVKYGIKYFANAALSGRKDIYSEAYKLYYASNGVKRTAADWRDILLKAEATAASPEKFELRMDGLVRRYADQFWQDDLIVAAYQAQAQAHGFTGGGGLNQGIKDELSESYRVDLYKGVLQDAFAMMMERKLLAAEKELSKQLDESRKILNRIYTLEFRDSAQRDDKKKSHFAGYTAQVAGLSDRVANPEGWSVALSDAGSGRLRFTLLGYIMAGMPTEVRLTAPGENTPEQTVPLQVSGPVTTILMSGGEEKDEAGGIASFSFAGGIKKTLTTYGLHAALAQAGAIGIGSDGSFSATVDACDTSAPTAASPFQIRVSGMQMSGKWDEKEGTGTCSITFQMESIRVDRNDLDDTMGYDELYYRTTYRYRDTVNATGAITREGNELVIKLNADVNRTGNTTLVRVAVDGGKTTEGDNPTVTDKSGGFRETATYRFAAR